LETPQEREAAVRQIGAGLNRGLLTVREAALLLGAIEARGGHIPDIAEVRRVARLETGLAKAAAAIGIDHTFTISQGPRAARAAAIAAARAAGWQGEAGPDIPPDYDLTPFLRADAVLRTEDGGRTTEDG